MTCPRERGKRSLWETLGMGRGRRLLYTGLVRRRALGMA